MEFCGLQCPSTAVEAPLGSLGRAPGFQLKPKKSLQPFSQNPSRNKQELLLKHTVPEEGDKSLTPEFVLL